MLIYVDKKKQKRQQIKYISLCVFLIFALIINLIYFKQTLHQTTAKLYNYTPKKDYGKIYEKADTVTLFTNKQETYPQIIIIPQSLSIPNIYTIATALSYIPNNTQQIHLTEELKEKEYILKIAQIFNPNIKESPQAPIIISTDIKKLLPQIYQNKLIPHVLGYNSKKTLKNNAQLKSLIEKKHTPNIIATDRLSQEKKNLQEFILKNQDIIKGILQTPDNIAFQKKYLSLQNITLCIQTNREIACELNQDTSLEQNLLNAKNKTTAIIDKIILLTSKQKISQDITLSADEGLYFQYQQREALLLPEELQGLSLAKAIALIKLKSGLNPKYQHKDMNFFKFKTAEIKLNDNI